MKLIIWGLAAGIVGNWTPSYAAEIQDRAAIALNDGGKVQSLSRKRHHTAVRPGRNVYVETEAPISPMACESVVFSRHPLCSDRRFDLNPMGWLWW
jgi:hypothetical protein